MRPSAAGRDIQGMSPEDERDPVQVWMRRLALEDALTLEERHALQGALDAPFQFRRGEVLADGGERGQFAVLVLGGLVARCKETAHGARQIVSILAPGDLCTGGLALVLPVDYVLVALSAGRAARMPAAAVRRLQATMPRLMLPLGRSLAEEAAITREWVVNLGARDGAERIAHLLCELRWRLAAVGLPAKVSDHLPLAQRDLAAAVGLSMVQVNRVLRDFRKTGLVAVGRGWIDILDAAGLADACDFDPHYLEARDTAPRALAWRGFQLSS
ncbi:MAG: Crp/Fnr family transcriptional regulator [Phenylobacterium sp.]